MARPAHAYWQHQFLHTARLPTAVGNISFLSDWQLHEKFAACAHNPIQISTDAPGSTRCRKLQNGKFSRNYTDTASAAQAFFDQLNLTDYPHLVEALLLGSPYGYDPAAGLALDLQKWGSVSFSRWYATDRTGTPAGGRGVPVPASKNVGAAWTHLMRTLARDGNRTSVELRRATASLNRIERRLRRV